MRTVRETDIPFGAELDPGVVNDVRLSMSRSVGEVATRVDSGDERGR